MLKSKKPVTFDQIESKGFGESVKNFRNLKGMSIHEIAARIGEDPEYVQNVESGNVSVGIKDVMRFSEALELNINMLVYNYEYENGEDATIDIYNETLRYDNDDEDAFMNEQSVQRALEIISECSDAECSYIVNMLHFVYDAYSDGVSNSVTLNYDDDDEYSDVESCMSCTVNYFQGISARDRAFLVSAIELSLSQIRAGMGFAYIPFPSAEIHPQMFLMAKAMDCHYSCDCSSCQA